MPPLARSPKLFGSARRTRTLLLIALLRETYPGELARLLEESTAAILYIVDGLEAEGVLASRRLGRTRRVSLDPRYYAAKELEALLTKLAEADPVLRKLATSRMRMT